MRREPLVKRISDGLSSVEKSAKNFFRVTKMPRVLTIICSFEAHRPQTKTKSEKPPSGAYNEKPFKWDTNRVVGWGNTRLASL
jgi:hypothetical protein